MLTKKQKIWLWIFGAMFAIPEIVWSPVLNFYYEFWQSGWSGNVHPIRNNFLQNSDNLNYLKLIFFIQSIGLILFLISLIKNRKSIKLSNYLLLIVLSIIILLLVAFVLYFALAVKMRLF